MVDEAEEGDEADQAERVQDHGQGGVLSLLVDRICDKSECSFLLLWITENLERELGYVVEVLAGRVGGLRTECCLDLAATDRLDYGRIGVRNGCRVENQVGAKEGQKC